MSVSEVTRTWSKSGGSINSAQANPFDVQFSFTDGYDVLLDAPETDHIAVIDQAIALGLPTIGYQHESGVNAFVTKLDPQCISPILWRVQVGYEGLSNDNAVVDVEWSDVTTSEPIDRDWNGRAIVTANNEQVDGLSVDIADQVVVIRRKFFFINTYSIRQYRRATNSDTFLGWPPGTARLIGFSAKNQFKYGAPQELWDVTARIQFREPFANTTAAQAWYLRWRHEGLIVRDDGSVKRRAFDDFKQDVTKPVLLKLNGEEETNPNNAVFIHTQVYGSLPYSALGLV
jgi:hypothetical protein